MNKLLITKSNITLLGSCSFTYQPGDREGTFSIFESSCHMLFLVYDYTKKVSFR